MPIWGVHYSLPYSNMIDQIMHFILTSWGAHYVVTCHNRACLAMHHLHDDVWRRVDIEFGAVDNLNEAATDESSLHALCECSARVRRADYLNVALSLRVMSITPIHWEALIFEETSLGDSGRFFFVYFQIFFCSQTRMYIALCRWSQPTQSRVPLGIPLHHPDAPVHRRRVVVLRLPHLALALALVCVDSRLPSTARPCATASRPFSVALHRRPLLRQPQTRKARQRHRLILPATNPNVSPRTTTPSLPWTPSCAAFRSNLSRPP